MASRKQAQTAASKHASRLARLGAHQIRTVDQGASGRSFAVQVSVTPDFAGELPDKLGCMVSGKKVQIPVLVKRAPKGAPE